MDNKIIIGRDVHRLTFDKKISFTFDGKKYSGYKGDTLASALIRNNVFFVGRSF